MPESTSKKYFSTRIVVNSDKYYEQSDNWKQDWWFCNNVSYADVVKTKGKVVSNVQISNVNDQEVKSVKITGTQSQSVIIMLVKTSEFIVVKTSHQNRVRMRPKCQ